MPSFFLFGQVTSLNSMSGILEDALREYNETHATMDLVLFEDAMKHVSKYLLSCYPILSCAAVLPSVRCQSLPIAFRSSCAASFVILLIVLVNSIKAGEGEVRYRQKVLLLIEYKPEEEEQVHFDIISSGAFFLQVSVQRKTYKVHDILYCGT